MQLVRFRDLGVPSIDGRGRDHDFGAGYVLGTVAFENERAQILKAIRDYRSLEIRPRNLVAEIQQHLGNPAHADAADAYEMNALNLGKHRVRVNFLATDLRGFTQIKTKIVK